MEVKEKKMITDVFVDGARKGWNIGISSVMPNVMMAFVIIHALKITGILDILGKVFGPVMAVFGLPGEAATVLMGAWLSMGGGVGVAVSLFTQGVIDGTQVAILTPAIFLMGAQIQYAGRLLGAAEVESRHYGILFGICILNAFLSMFVMRFFV
jgi:spore maturation protein SpmB